MDFSFRYGYAMKYCDGLFLYPGRQRAGIDKLFDFLVIAAMRVLLFVIMIVIVFMMMLMLVAGMSLIMRFMSMRMGMGVCMSHTTRMSVFVFMGMLVRVFMMMFMIIVIMVVMLVQVNIELKAVNVGFLSWLDMQMIAIELQLFQFTIKLRRLHADIEQRANKHVATDAAENIEIKRFHKKLRNPSLSIPFVLSCSI